jgi:hypothetical protein
VNEATQAFNLSLMSIWKQNLFNFYFIVLYFIKLSSKISV